MKVVIVSGYFNPLHGGHLDMIEAAAKMGDHLIVIVNNDKQQLLKKAKSFLTKQIVCAYCVLSRVLISRCYR